MSKSITIPQIGADPLIVVIDGSNPQKFQAGETYTVADDVAEIINNLIASFPKEAVPTEATVVAPIPTVADAGKVLGIDDEGKFALTEGGGDESDILVLSLVPHETVPDAATFDKSYTEISNAITNNKLIMIDNSEEGNQSKHVFCGVSEPDGYIQLNLPPTIYKGAGNALTVQLIYYEMNSETGVVTPYFAEYTVATTA